MSSRPKPARRTAAFHLSWDARLPDGTKPGLDPKNIPEEIEVIWQPRILGNARPALTGIECLPRGIALELIRIERVGNECVARYRVRRVGQRRISRK